MMTNEEEAEDENDDDDGDDDDDDERPWVKKVHAPDPLRAAWIEVLSTRRQRHGHMAAGEDSVEGL